jgi:hypothetical protein
MMKSVKSRAEEKFAQISQRDKKAAVEKKKADQERAEHVTKLRTLRLAKEASDREEAARIKAIPKKPKAARRKRAATVKAPTKPELD